MIAAAPPPAAAPPAAAEVAARVLVVSDPRGFVHPGIAVKQQAVVRAVGGTVLPRARDLTAARLRDARLVVFLDTTGDPPLGPGGKARLLRFVRAGGGLAGLHASSNAFRRWPAWGPLLGARFARHPALRRDRVRITAAPGDPAVAGVPRSFAVHDELYVFKTDPARRATVLARLATHDHRALAWRRREGSGRVFYDALGHAPSAWAATDPRMRLVTAGLRWAMGGT